MATETGFGPMCRCGSRNTARVGDSGLLRQCQKCGETFAYRIVDGYLVPFALPTGIALDTFRRERAIHV